MKNLTKLKYITNNLSILYVESNPQLQNKLYNYFEPLFMAFYQAYDGLDGFNQYVQHRPEIIITSLSLLKKNAFEMIVDIQHINPNANIIVVSEKNDTFELLETLDLGLRALLLKPINIEKLTLNLNKIILTKFNTVSDDSKNIIMDAISNKKQVSCISNYKGLVLRNNANLISFNTNSFNIRVTKTQLYAALYEKHIIIEIENNYIVATITEADERNGVLKLVNPRTISYKYRDKENKRIAVDKAFKTSITYNKTQKELIPVDISYNYISVESPFILDIHENDTLDLTIGFEINGPVSFINEKKFTKIFATGKITRIDTKLNKQKIVLQLDVKKAGQNVFKKYIQQREIDIINEFKQKLKI
ncbi:MAG: response regulator [Arcobacteraceae bacterium]